MSKWLRMLLVPTCLFGGCLCGCISMDRHAIDALKEVAASGKVTADDPQISAEFYTAYGIRIALDNVDVEGEAAMQKESTEETQEDE